MCLEVRYSQPNKLRTLCCQCHDTHDCCCCTYSLLLLLLLRCWLLLCWCAGQNKSSPMRVGLRLRSTCTKNASRSTCSTTRGDGGDVSEAPIFPLRFIRVEQSCSTCTPHSKQLPEFEPFEEFHQRLVKLFCPVFGDDRIATKIENLKS